MLGFLCFAKATLRLPVWLADGCCSSTMQNTLTTFMEIPHKTPTELRSNHIGMAQERVSLRIPFPAVALFHGLSQRQVAQAGESRHGLLVDQEWHVSERERLKSDLFPH